MRKFSIVPVILVLLGVTFALTPETISLADAEKLAGGLPNCTTVDLVTNDCSLLKGQPSCNDNYYTCDEISPQTRSFLCATASTDGCTIIADGCFPIGQEALSTNPCNIIQ